MEAFRKSKILGIPMWIILIMTIIMMVASYLELVPNNMIGALALVLCLGGVIGELGDHIPVWKTWCGGGMMLAFFAAAAIGTYQLMPDSTITVINDFTNVSGFLDMYIVILITGSVLSIERKFLLKSFAGFIPIIFGGVLCSFLLAGLAGLLLGKGALSPIMDIALPVMGGGNGGGAVPMSQIWAEATGGDSTSWYASAFATLMLGNLVSILFGAVLNYIGIKFPKLSGNGQLMRATANDDSSLKDEYKPVLIDYVSGLTLAVVLYSLASLYSSKISIINNLNLGFTVHTFAFMVLFAAILALTGIIPKNVRAGAKGMQNFFSKYLSFPLMICVGISTNLNDFLKVFASPSNIIIIILVVVGAVIGSGFVGHLLGFYFIESAVAGGLCMSNAGGSGDIAVLGASNRMEMISYAQIASRIGGAFMLVIASIIFGYFA